MPNGVIGNTTDSGSVKSRFEPWLGNKKPPSLEVFFVYHPYKKRDSSEPLFLFSLAIIINRLSRTYCQT